MSLVHIFLLFLFAKLKVFSCTPVVLWHGVGDDHLTSIKQMIRQHVNETIYIKSIQLGDNAIDDLESGIFVHPNEQIAEVCFQIAADENLRNGFHAIGFSQGSQFLRGLIQRCAAAKVINFISLGGQHQGVFGIPACSSERLVCRFYRFVLNKLAYTNWAQKHIAQASYWHDPFNEKKYRMKSSFLADINNEVVYNENYVRRLQGLNKFVMVKFIRDTIVQPIETSWFGYYMPQSDETVLSLSESQTYIRDNLGLKQMMKDGKLVFLEVDDEHVSFPDEWFVKEIIPFML